MTASDTAAADLRGMGDVIDLQRHRRWQRREQRVPLPAELVSVVQFGVDHPGAVGPLFWAAVEAAVAEQVFGEVPASASDLSLELDADRLDVRARWREPDRSAVSRSR